MRFEGSKAYGMPETYSFWYSPDHKFSYGEYFLLKFSCHLQFKAFPFDSQEYCMSYGENKDDASMGKYFSKNSETSALQ